MNRISRWTPVWGWLVVFSLGGCPKDSIEQREGIGIVLTVSDRFPRQLVTGSQWVVRALPGAGPIALRQAPANEGLIGDFPYTAQVLDRDADGKLEYEILIQGKIFSFGTRFEGIFLSQELTTAPFAIEIRLLGSSGILATRLATSDVRGRPLRFGTNLGLKVELRFDCGFGVPCRDDENRPPSISRFPEVISIAPGRELIINVTATDPDGDDVALDAPNLSAFPQADRPAWDAATGTFAWTPTAASIREEPYDAVFTASDSRGASAEPRTVRVKVAAGNSTPVIRAVRDVLTGNPVGGDLYVAELAPAMLVVDAYDPDGDALTVRADAVGFVPSFDPASNTFTWTPPLGATREMPYDLTFVASDGTAEGKRAVGLFVVGRNLPPVFDGVGEQVAVAGTELAFDVVARDPNGDPFTVTFDAADLPAGHNAAYDPATGRFTWTPTVSHLTPQGGSPAAAVFRAADDKGATSILRVPIRVQLEPLPDGGTGSVTDCPYTCIPGEVCVGGLCLSATLPCLAECTEQQVCLGGQCLETEAESCGATCPSFTVCVRGTCLADRDLDGIADPFDYCPDRSAPQVDQDGDRMGDVCDPQSNVSNLSLVAGAAVSGGARSQAGEVRVFGTLGVWALPAVHTNGQMTIRSGPAALGGATSRAPKHPDGGL